MNIYPFLKFPDNQCNQVTLAWKDISKYISSSTIGSLSKVDCKLGAGYLKIA